MANNFPVIDNGIIGVKDDGSDEGIVKMKLEQGELIKLPINSFAVGTEIQVVLGTSGSASQSNTSFGNGDGTASSMNMSTQVAGLGTNYSLINTLVYGKVIGVRFRRFSITPSFSVVIDGIPYDCPTYRQKPYTNNTMNISGDRESYWIVAEGLEDIQHSVSIFLYPDATVTKTLVFYGFLVEKRVGYKEFEKNDFIYSSGTLTASSVVVPSTDAASQIVKSVKSIMYQNTDTLPRFVTITYNNIVIAKIYLAASGINGDSFKYDFGTGVNIGGSTASLSHLADLAGKINFVTIGNS